MPPTTMPSPLPSPAPTHSVCEGMRWNGNGLRLTDILTSAPTQTESAPTLRKMNTKTKTRREVSEIVPRFRFGRSIQGCGGLDSSVIRGLNKPQCGAHNRKYHCDQYNLTQACTGAAAIPGSAAMASVCSRICGTIPACSSYMVDNSFNADTGLCILMEGEQSVSPSCFYQSGSAASEYTGYQNCSNPACVLCTKKSRVNLNSLTFRWEANDGTSQVEVAVKRATVDDRGVAIHGRTLTIESKKTRFKGSIAITIGRQKRKLQVNCKSPLVIGDSVDFKVGRLVLVDATTTEGDDAAALCRRSGTCERGSRPASRAKFISDPKAAGVSEKSLGAITAGFVAIATLIAATMVFVARRRSRLATSNQSTTSGSASGASDLTRSPNEAPSVTSDHFRPTTDDTEESSSVADVSNDLQYDDMVVSGQFHDFSSQNVLHLKTALFPSAFEASAEERATGYQMLQYRQFSDSSEGTEPSAEVTI